MSRSYLNERWCVRCGRTGPTPYLRKHVSGMMRWALFVRDTPGARCNSVLKSDGAVVRVLDIGCGNGRNSDYMKNAYGCTVFPVDMVTNRSDVVNAVLGASRLPDSICDIDIVLANYVFMFLDPEERRQLVHELLRVTKPGSVFVIELYSAVDSYCKTPDALQAMKAELLTALLPWQKISLCKERFIVRRMD